ncbi:hypothetical protein VIGAN_03068500 [Vigna angularis var. angularis]|uniref:Uncharacterized protein n=1 Tax=Vigna angularis var. angularis TaxID=157739 RepID=A0A0S3RK93_PHAAN|nr:hypothetical protein VIGAN_03068500 [Vigna angularis var. angularis]
MHSQENHRDSQASHATTYIHFHLTIKFNMKKSCGRRLLCREVEKKEGPPLIGNSRPWCSIKIFSHSYLHMDMEAKGRSTCKKSFIQQQLHTFQLHHSLVQQLSQEWRWVINLKCFNHQRDNIIII